MTIDEAARILRRMYDAGGSSDKRRRSTAVHLFGIKHADDLWHLSLKEIVRQAGLPDSYSDEVSKGRALAEYVQVVNDFP
jgi:hypothetical protein